jgi:hypothetical protein
MPLPRFKRFTRCYKCGLVFSERVLEGGLCWLCAGKRRPPKCLEDKEEAIEIGPDCIFPFTEEPPKGESGP